MKSSKKSTYSQSGVSIDAGNKLVELIKPLVHSTQRPGADTQLGGFGGLFDPAMTGYKDPILVSSTDGVGTKLKIAQAVGKHDTIGIDLVAMMVNDIIVQGAEPLFFLDCFSTGKLDVNIAYEVIKGITTGCKEAGCALIGGETAEMPGMYQEGDYDLVGFSVGMVERDKVLPRKDIKEGDIVIGIASSGVHSNGFSLVRHIIDNNGLSYNSTPDGFNKTLGEELLTPTKIYVKTCLNLINNCEIKALAHITGGGLTENIPRVLPDNIAVKIDRSSWDMPYIFKWLQKTGNIDTTEMLRVFNCGIGMIIIAPKESLIDIQKILKNNGEKYLVIGKTILRNGENVVFE